MDHFLSAIREVSELPIVFYYDKDIYSKIFKFNELYKNIYHFMGEFNDIKHFSKAQIEKAFCVIILSNVEASESDIEDASSIKIVRLIE